ncbi:metal ion binding [Pyrenophora seminiperda CCB06]|uniref:Metal ion binding n=1 Tax=Pyrenophora seminiperda CCB06 TaxID=1302712 RepID=A0A3M7M7T4_9PLEO|nr:metal ion binding [Pyrenophora seminiperda CCB06]
MTSTGSFPTPDSQRARTRSLLSNNDSIFETPHAKSNANIALQGQQYRMSPHGANISSGSPAPMASVRPFQQDYKATFMGSPLGNNIGSTQQVQPMQQPMYMGNLSPLDQGQSLQNANMGKMSTSFLHQSQFSQSSHMGNMYNMGNMGNMGTMGHMGNMQSLAFPPVPANLVLSSMVDEHPDQPAFQPQTQNAMGMDSSPWPMPQPMMGNSPHVFPSNGADMMNTTAYSPQEMMGGSQLAVSESPAPTLQGTTSICSTPAPRSATSASVRISRATTRRGRTGGPQKVPCVNCYKNWWEDSCDAGETCVNCALENTDCIRQRCFYFSTGCSKRQCPTVHEGDTRYTDDRFLVDQNKAGKRPGRVGKSTDALTAPTLRGKQGQDGVVN